MVRATDDRYGLWCRHTGYAERPEIAAQSDHALAVWRESLRRAWTVDTTVLTMVRDRLRDDEKPGDAEPWGAG